MAIVVVLVVVLYWWYNWYMQRARDFVRRSDLNNIAFLLNSEKYYSDSLSEYIFLWEKANKKIDFIIKDFDFYKWNLNNKKLSKIPKDPKTNDNYFLLTDNNLMFYYIEAELENIYSDEYILKNKNFYNKEFFDNNWKKFKKTYYYITNFDNYSDYNWNIFNSQDVNNLNNWDDNFSSDNKENTPVKNKCLIQKIDLYNLEREIFDSENINLTKNISDDKIIDGIATYEANFECQNGILIKKSENKLYTNCPSGKYQYANECLIPTDEKCFIFNKINGKEEYEIISYIGESMLSRSNSLYWVVFRGFLEKIYFKKDWLWIRNGVPFSSITEHDNKYIVDYQDGSSDEINFAIINILKIIEILDIPQKWEEEAIFQFLKDYYDYSNDDVNDFKIFLEKFIQTFGYFWKQQEIPDDLRNFLKNYRWKFSEPLTNLDFTSIEFIKSKNCPKKVIIPPYFKWLPITSITNPHVGAESWNYFRWFISRDLEEVYFPDSIKNIWNHSFSWNPDLTKIVFGRWIEQILHNSFQDTVNNDKRKVYYPKWKYNIVDFAFHSDVNFIEYE